MMEVQMARKQSALAKYLGRMFTNLGALFGQLYGTGNGGATSVYHPPRPAQTTRRSHKKKTTS
jgi:hypothetical protein